MLLRFRPRIASSLGVIALLAAVAPLGAGCDDGGRESDSEREGEVVVVAGEASPETIDVELPEDIPFDHNPLNLPPASTSLKRGDHVFAIPRALLGTAAWGRSLSFGLATVDSVEGGRIIIRQGTTAPYPIHPGYVIPLRKGHFGFGRAVLAPLGGRMHHGVVRGLRRNRVLVRYTDLGRKLGDHALMKENLGLLTASGFVPGKYAAHATGAERRLVTLVSRVMKGGSPFWLVLDHRGASGSVAESKLTPLPLPRLRPRVGDELLVAHEGSFVPGKIRSIDRPSWITVGLDQAGAPAFVGPDMLLRE